MYRWRRRLHVLRWANEAAESSLVTARYAPASHVQSNQFLHRRRHFLSPAALRYHSHWNGLQRSRRRPPTPSQRHYSRRISPRTRRFLRLLGTSYPSSVSPLSSLIFTSSSLKKIQDVRRAAVDSRQPPTQLVGLSEQEREWSTCSHSSYYGYSPVQRNVTSSPPSPTVTLQVPRCQRLVFPNRLLGASSIAQVPFPHAMCSSTSHLPLTLDLIVLPQVQHFYNRQQHLCRPWQS